MIVSRATGKDDSLSTDIKNEMFSDPRVLGVVSGLLAFMGVVPGMPTAPFLLISAVAGAKQWKISFATTGIPTVSEIAAGS